MLLYGYNVCVTILYINHILFQSFLDSISDRLKDEMFFLSILHSKKESFKKVSKSERYITFPQDTNIMFPKELKTC